MPRACLAGEPQEALVLHAPQGRHIEAPGQQALEDFLGPQPPRGAPDCLGRRRGRRWRRVRPWVAGVRCEARAGIRAAVLGAASGFVGGRDGVGCGCWWPVCPSAELAPCARRTPTHHIAQRKRPNRTITANAQPCKNNHAPSTGGPRSVVVVRGCCWLRYLVRGWLARVAHGGAGSSGQWCRRRAWCGWRVRVGGASAACVWSGSDPVGAECRVRWGRRRLGG